MENLNRRTFFAYAIRVYNNPSCSGVAEFRDDLLRIKYVKRLIRRYVKTGRLKPRLLINHLIGMNNVFLPEAVSRLLFFKLSEEEWPALKTALEYVNLMPECVPLISGIDILKTDIATDEIVLKELQSLER